MNEHWHRVYEILRTRPGAFFKDISWILAAFVAVYAIGLFGWQILFWLKNGTWISCDLLTLMTDQSKDNVGPRMIVPYLGKVFPDFSNWLRYPTDWLGIHKIVMPILNLMGFHILLGLLALLLVSEAEEANKK